MLAFGHNADEVSFGHERWVAGERFQGRAVNPNRRGTMNGRSDNRAMEHSRDTQIVHIGMGAVGLGRQIDAADRFADDLEFATGLVTALPEKLRSKRFAPMSLP